ncbi:uncharacterized protein JCM15063_004166 [Sporobolomyces koalae]|uniref:uncharacterized protein n=1 Tax=Sporobolomyces koalae TaxID=500713 RepID=UPI0031775974
MEVASHTQQLESLLPLIQATRSSLPALIASLSTSTSSPGPPLDLATLYRLASTQCEQSIKSLTERLQTLESVLDQAEASYEQNPVEVAVADHPKRDAWQEVGDVLAGTTDSKAKKAGVPFQPTCEPPTTNEQLVEFLNRWETLHPRVKLSLEIHPTEVDVAELELVLRGVMRVALVLRWQDIDEPGAQTLVVELAACSALKERNPLYRPSQFSLFQDLTNSTMSLIDKSVTRSGPSTSNFEEVLTFLSDPPLPF